MIDHLTLLYSVSTFGLIVVCMLLAAVRWFHMCKPFDEYGSMFDIVDVFGGKEKYIEAVEELEKELYAS